MEIHLSIVIYDRSWQSIENVYHKKGRGNSLNNNFINVSYSNTLSILKLQLTKRTFVWGKKLKVSTSHTDIRFCTCCFTSFTMVSGLLVETLLEAFLRALLHSLISQASSAVHSIHYLSNLDPVFFNLTLLI